MNHSSKSGHDGTWVPKPLRMRSACMQCHAIKIRCSGEKTGCTRCKASGLSCEYAVSMVGRMSKRSKQAHNESGQNANFIAKTNPQRNHENGEKNRNEHENENGNETANASSTANTNMNSTGNAPSNTIANVSPNRNSSSNTNTNSDVNANSSVHVRSNVNANILADEDLVALASEFSHTHPEHSVPLLPPDFSIGAEDFLLQSDELLNHSFGDGYDTHLLPVDIRTDIRKTLPCQGSTLQGLSHDFEIDRLWMPAFNQSNDASMLSPTQSMSPASFAPSYPQTPPRTSSRSSQDPVPPPKQDGNTQLPHVSALCKIISLLEAHARAKTIAIDEVMRINKACMADISRIRAMEEYKMCNSCGMLISTSLELIMSLYESGILSKVLQPPSQNSLLPVRHREDKLPSLQFGVFELDRDEQIGLSNRIIRKELQKSIEFIRDIAADCRAPRGESISYNKVRTQWHNEMEQRAKTLVSSLGSYPSHGSGHLGEAL